MAAFGLDDVVALRGLQQLARTEAGPGPDNTDHAHSGERSFGAANMLEMLIAKLSDGMGDRAEIVDDLELGNAQLLVDQCGPDHPRIVGQP